MESLTLAVVIDGNISILLNNGDGTFASGVNYAVRNASSITSADFDGNGTSDLAVAIDDVMDGPENVSILLNNGDGTFAKAVGYKGKGKRTKSVCAADFDGDGKPDLALLHLSSDKVSILRNKGNGTFSKARTYSVWNKPSDAAFLKVGKMMLEYLGINHDSPAIPSAITTSAITTADFDGDQRPDLAVTYHGYFITVDGTQSNAGRYNSVAILRNKRNGKFEDAVDYHVRWQTSSICTDDFDGDGMPDLVVTYVNHDSISVLKNTGTGKFFKAANYWAGGPVCSISPADFDGDGTPDLGIANWKVPHNDISILKNDGSATFTFTPIHNSGTGDDRSRLVTAADFNGDDYPDLAMANVAHGSVSIFLFRNLEESKTAEEQYAIGDMYYLGKGVPQNQSEAATWFQKAANQSYLKAQIQLGYMYFEGKGVPQNYTEAADWFRKVAEQGSAQAQFNLGWMYRNGKGVPQSDSRAVYWYRSAADQGFAEAQHNLGILYASGEGVPQSDSEAANWYRKAADQGLEEAQYSLGKMYADGRGVRQSDFDAVSWYRKAADQGHSDAQRQLDLTLAKMVSPADVNSFRVANMKYQPSDDMVGLIQADDGVYSSYFEISQRLSPGVYLVRIPSSKYLFHCTIPSYVKMTGFVSGTTFRAVVEAKGEYDYCTVQGSINTVKKITVLYGEKVGH